VELHEKRITRYIEPFLGGVAVFFDIMQSYHVEEAVLFDINEELILCYKVVQREPATLANLLDEHRRHFLDAPENQRAEYYYTVRSRFNEHKAETDFANFSDNWIERAADLIFLNKTCFNGLFRVNSAGMFNVPFGAYRKPEVFVRENLLRASELLQRATLHCDTYHGSRSQVTDSSFVYFDPPYRPLSPSSNFTSYARDGFGDPDQLQLAAYFAQLNATTGAKLMLSNSDPGSVSPGDTFLERAYAAFCIHRVEATRMINSVGHARGKVSELIITNYTVPTNSPEPAASAALPRK